MQIRGSIVVSISACHAEDPGSIPGHGVADAEVMLSDEDSSAACLLVTNGTAS